MSYGGGYQGGRVRMSTRIFLNVYDLSPANEFLYNVGLGLHHSGVEIDGVEYTFGSGGGMFDMPPKIAPGAKYREQYDMGTFDGGKQVLNKVLDDLRKDFGPNDYNIITKNCNTFANALCYKLNKQQIPSHINRLADLGNCCSYFIPKQWLDSSPVDDPNAPSSGGAPQNMGMNRGSSSTSTKSTSSFTGTGSRLGGGSSTTTSSSSFWNSTTSSSSSSSSGQDDLVDRREKARKAALARLERIEKENLLGKSS